MTRPMLRAAVVAGAASLLLAVPPSGAQEPAGDYLIDIQGWRGGAYGRQDTGTFSHCGISRTFDNGATLVIQTNPERFTNVALVREDWTLEPEAESPVRLSIDGGFERTLGAVAAEATVLVIPTGDDEDLYQALRRGNTLTVETPMGQWQFPLVGTARSLNALRECVGRVNDLVASDPEALRGDAEGLPNGMPIEALASILNAAGLEDLAFMAPGAVPDNALDLLFVWRTGPEEAPVIGGLHQRPRGEGVQMDRFATGYVDVLREICPDGFGSQIGETEMIAGTYALSTAEAECVTEEGADFVSLFFALDDFNYSVFYHMTSADNRAAAEAATEGVARVVRDLANQAAEAAAARQDESAADPGAADTHSERRPEAGPAAGEAEESAPAEDSAAEDSAAEDSAAEDSAAEDTAAEDTEADNAP